MSTRTNQSGRAPPNSEFYPFQKLRGIPQGHQPNPGKASYLPPRGRSPHRFTNPPTPPPSTKFFGKKFTVWFFLAYFYFGKFTVCILTSLHSHDLLETWIPIQMLLFSQGNWHGSVESSQSPSWKFVVESLNTLLKLRKFSNFIEYFT